MISYMTYSMVKNMGNIKRNEVMKYLLSKITKQPSLDNLLEEEYNRNNIYYKIFMYILSLEKEVKNKWELIFL